MIIAIDGPAAAGKGTLARRLADEFGFAYLDTGGLYRAVGLSVLRAGGNPADAGAAEVASVNLDLALLDDPALRAEETGTAASKVAVLPVVRSNLLDFQRNFASNPPGDAAGAVLDGRDIGTIVCPDADLKLFVTASAEVRAKRRFRELEERGLEPEFHVILADVRERDERDMNRKDAPLRPAEDALLLDTSNLDIDAVFLRAAALVNKNRTSQ
ncbi:(d)CMP kinase [Kordiimonas sp.]|uniref:(d)CMP kinase n=1 Tax=Kordiimonas sp. TaxID=1970157 RepID=UPI003A929E3C